MSRENVEIVRRGLEAGMRSPKPDFDTMNSLFHPDHEFVSLLDSVEGRNWRGARGFRQWLFNFEEAFDSESQLEEVSVIDAHRVLAVTLTRGRGRLGGVPFEQRAWFVMTVQDGKVTRTEVHPSREQALEAAGLAE